MAAAAAPRLTGGVVASVVLHAGFVAGFFVLRSSAPPPSPPLYRVQLFAAPPGERAIGVVQEAPVTPPPPVPEVVTPPKSVPVRPKLAPPKVKAKPAPKAATPVEQAAPVAQPKTPPPTAGGGSTGGPGTDVANVSTGGIDFPYPGYVRGVANAIIRAFPSTRMTYTAEVRFVIRRDGSVDPESIKLVTSSGNYSFDEQALGAVESAANAKAFGPLPPGFREDILPVNFRFSPSLIR